jgi:hypothetical protein
MASEKEKVRRRLLKRFRWLVNEHKQIGLDIQSWNDAHPGEQPIDFEGDVVAADLAKKILVLIESGKPIPDKLWNRYWDHCEENAGRRGGASTTS